MAPFSNLRRFDLRAVRKAKETRRVSSAIFRSEGSNIFPQFFFSLARREKIVTIAWILERLARGPNYKI